MTRADLEGFIAQTKRTQRRLGIVLAIVFVAALVGTIVHVPFAPHVIGLVVLVALCGFWVTGAHITDWRRRIADLRDPSQAPPISNHRRYQR